MKRKRRYPDDYPYVEKNENFSGVASATECTGLTAKDPTDDEQVLSYKEIYNIPLEPNCPPITDATI